jgi:hypothetical protein
MSRLIFIIPPTGNHSEVISVSKRAGLKVVQASSARDFILISAAESSPIVIVADSGVIKVLAQNAVALLEEIPLALLYAPGVLYTSEWTTLSSVFIPETFPAFLERWKKSGHVQTTPRSLGDDQVPITSVDSLTDYEQDSTSEETTDDNHR